MEVNQEFPSMEMFMFIAELTVVYGPWDDIDSAYYDCMYLWELFVNSQFYIMETSYLTCVQAFIAWVDEVGNILTRGI